MEIIVLDVVSFSLFEDLSIFYSMLFATDWKEESKGFTKQKKLTKSKKN